jgi:hypothetical protein
MQIETTLGADLSAGDETSACIWHPNGTVVCAGAYGADDDGELKQYGAGYIAAADWNADGMLLSVFNPLTAEANGYAAVPVKPLRLPSKKVMTQPTLKELLLKVLNSLLSGSSLSKLRFTLDSLDLRRAWASSLSPHGVLENSTMTTLKSGLRPPVVISSLPELPPSSQEPLLLLAPFPSSEQLK